MIWIRIITNVYLYNCREKQYSRKLGKEMEDG